MLDNHFRNILPGICSPLISLYKRMGLHPNHLTMLGLLGAVLSALLVISEYPLGAVCVWWLSRLLDGTDGIWARESGQASRFGAYLDILCDMAAYSIMIPAFSFLYPDCSQRLSWVLILYVLCITSALALGMQQAVEGQQARDNRGLRLGAGLVEAGETGLAYTAMLLLPGYFSVILWFWILLLSATVLFRTLLAYRTLDVHRQ